MDRPAVLKQALADFDAAVAGKDLRGLETQRLYRKALAGFESLVTDGVENGKLYYNIGNAYLRLGDIGHAVVNYRRALRLIPGDADVRKNLQVARKLCEVQVAPRATSAFIETILFWHYGSSLAARMRFALAGYCIFWGLMMLGLFAMRRVPGLSWTIRIVGAVVLIVGTSAVWEGLTQENRMEGVIIAQDVVLRKGYSEDYEPQLEQTLTQGVEFQLLDTRRDVSGDSWYQVRLRDGKQGWLRADQVDVI